MTISKTQWTHMFRTAAADWKAQADILSKIDSRFGDGDHGVTIKKIAKVFEQQTEKWAQEPLALFLENLGAAIMAVGGGSAGPLYGTLVEGLATPLVGSAQQETDAATVKAMLAGSRDAMFEISTARVGDKTMMDALIPAVEAAAAAPDEPGAILQAAAQAAEEGAKASEGYVSKYGRARSYKEQTIGTPDAGAVSTAILLRALEKGYHQS